jgi:hypothetical protein
MVAIEMNCVIVFWKYSLDISNSGHKLITSVKSNNEPIMIRVQKSKEVVQMTAKFSVEPKDVFKTIESLLLRDGFDIVIDMEKSRAAISMMLPARQLA